MQIHPPTYQARLARRLQDCNLRSIRTRPLIQFDAEDEEELAAASIFGTSYAKTVYLWKMIAT